ASIGAGRAADLLARWSRRLARLARPVLGRGRRAGPRTRSSSTGRRIAAAGHRPPVPARADAGLLVARARARHGPRRKRRLDRARTSRMSRMRRSSAGFVLAWLLAVAIAGGQSADPHVLERLRELGRASASVTTLRAHFVQEKRLSIVRDVLHSSGTFLLDKRGRVVWDVAEPDPVRIVITRDGVYAGGKRVAGGA